MAYDLVVRGGVVVTGDAPVAADVGVEGGLVVAVGPELGAGREEIDATGLHVLPGGVDPHVHFDEPGRTGWEGFASGSLALAAGGYTTFVDMPLNSLPPTLDGEAFDLKVAAAAASSLVDFALWGGLVPGRLDRLEELVERGVAGFKAFMCPSGVEEFPAADDPTLLEGMRRCAELGLPVLVHAENERLIEALVRRAQAEGRTSCRDVARSRPVVAELEAISRALTFAWETGCALHVVHVSSARGVLLVDEARRRGQDVSCEVCPHHLLFCEDDLERLGALGKCAPPLRPGPEPAALWDLLRQGVVEMVASDHSPCPPELKAGDDAFAAWGGIAGCQSTRQLLLAAGPERGLDETAVAALTATHPARRFALGAKGAVEPGRDADLALFDLSHRGRLSASDLRYRHPVSPFVGEPVRGRVVRTLLRGRTVLLEGRPVGDRAGRLVRPARDTRSPKGGP